MTYSYNPSGVCARQIVFDLEDGIVSNVKFKGGCPGNLQAISILTEGMKAEDIIGKLKGNQCGFRGTSCTDQLCIALEEALKG